MSAAEGSNAAGEEGRSAQEEHVGSGSRGRDRVVKVGGSTSIADSVAAKIAGVVARRVPGVHALGSGAAKALGSLRDALGQGDDSQGIKVSLTEDEASVAVTLTVEFGYALHEVAEDVREAVYVALRDWVDLKVSEVDVDITDVFVGGEPEPGRGDETGTGE